MRETDERERKRGRKKMKQAAGEGDAQSGGEEIILRKDKKNFGYLPEPNGGLFYIL